MAGIVHISREVLCVLFRVSDYPQYLVWGYTDLLHWFTKDVTDLSDAMQFYWTSMAKQGSYVLFLVLRVSLERAGMVLGVRGARGSW